MNIEIETSRLLKPLALINGVVERRQTIPILSNVFLRMEGGALTLIGTDLEVEITLQLQDVTGEDGECTLAARKLYDICRALPDSATVTIEPGDDGNNAQVRSGRSRFKLQTLPAGDFPKIDTKDWEERIRIRGSELDSLLDATAFSMAQQDVRYFLNGVLLEIEGDALRAVATDSHRLAKSEIALSDGDHEHRQSIVPRKAVLEMQRFLENRGDELVMEINPNHIRVRNETSTLTAKLIDGRFPDYRAVIAQRLSTTLEHDRLELIHVLSRASILTNEKFRNVRLNLKPGLLVVTAHNPEQEEANDEVEIAYDGEELDIGFNVDYVLDALKAISSENVEIKLQDTNNSCALQAPGEERTLYLIMPVRL